MRLPALAAALFVAAALAACTTPNGTPPVDAPTTPPAAANSFRAPVNLTSPDGAGSEPSILASRKDGALYIVSVLGSATARGDGLWKSTDGGDKWDYLGKPDYPFGGGDADMDEDAAGTLYLPGQWRPAAPPANPVAEPYVTGGESMATSMDGGATWTTNPLASDMPVTDRQWTATLGTGTAFLAFNQAQRGLVVTKSADSGKTWSPAVVIEGTWDPGDGVLVSGGPNGIPGDWAVDDKTGTIYLPYSSPSRDHRLFVSQDAGATFTQRNISGSTEGEQRSAIFGSLAVDADGALYYVWCETKAHGQEGMRIRLVTSTDGGVTWSAPQDVTPHGYTAVFPWIVVGDPGHVAVAFYLSPGMFRSDVAPPEAEWYPVVAFGAQGARDFTFDYVTLSPRPNHKGPLCTGGTSCSAGTRELGDFFEIGLTRDSKVVAAWVDDTVEPRVNAFAHQDLGSLMAQGQRP